MVNIKEYASSEEIRELCHHISLPDLPENTTIQKAVKKHLLNGGGIGWATGIYKPLLTTGLPGSSNTYL